MSDEQLNKTTSTAPSIGSWFTKKEWIVLGAAVVIVLGGTTAVALTPKAAPPKKEAVAAPKANDDTDEGAEEVTPPAISVTESVPATQTSTETTKTTVVTPKTTPKKATLATKKPAQKEPKPKKPALPVTPLPQGSTIADFGFTVQYGVYDGKPLVWNIIDLNDDEIILLANKVVSAGAFRTDWETANSNSYKTSDVHTWLNDTFAKAAFTTPQADAIIPRETAGTIDPLFLLTSQEVEQYFPKQTARKVGATQWARSNPGYSSEVLALKEGASSWWLADATKKTTGEVQVVHSDGKISSEPVYYGDIGVRPAIVLDRSLVDLNVGLSAGL